MESEWRLSCVFGFCLLILAGLAHPDGAGRCDSPRSGHHERGLEGTGDYVLTVHPKKHTKPKEVVLRLEGERKNQTLRGFHIVCEACVFLNLPTEDAQLNERYCQLPGRVKHRDKSDKKRVEIDARLKPKNGAEIHITYYVVKTLLEWYGPMNLTLDAKGRVLEESYGLKDSSQERGTVNVQNSPEDDDDTHNKAGNHADDDDGSADDDQQVHRQHADDDHHQADDDDDLRKNCQESTDPDFDCMAQITDYFNIHWSVTSKATQPDKLTKLEMLIAVKTPGWASLSFARIKGKMHPADAVLGWMEDDGTSNVHSYHIEDDVTPENQNSTLFDLTSINRTGDWLYIRFTKVPDSGLVPVNLLKSAFLNFATGKENRLIEHDRWGSLELDFSTGQAHRVSSLNYYQAHGCLMILAWIVFVPLSMTVARSKWSPNGMGLYGWLDLHRGIHLFAVIALVSALLIAVLNFQSIESRTGRVHRLLGILTSLFFACQASMGFLRPAAQSPLRPLFVAAHTWGGRCLMLLSWITVFIGIAAFHYTTSSSPSPWISSVLILLLVQLSVALFFEWGPKQVSHRRGNTAEVDMVQISYAHPRENDSDEHYTSD